MIELVPHALKDAPALIESVFPAHKVSFEAQRERNASQGQTLTGLGSYWTGRKPLILVRAIVLGSLLPQTDTPSRDLEIFEKLMAFNEKGLARRAVIHNSLKAKDLASMIKLDKPWECFVGKPQKHSLLSQRELDGMTFPLDADYLGVTIRWKRGLSDDAKANLYYKALKTLKNYETKADLCKRPEEVDQKWLFAPIWGDVNNHYAQFGVNAGSHDELVEQLGMLRYGRRPKVGDTFSGGGSIPFEAARLGCDVYASDLNPIACMLTWGALNIVGALPERRKQIEKAQQEVISAVDKEIIALDIEHDKNGNRAKAYLYCLETRCNETGWLVPILPNRIISKSRNTIARLLPNYERKRFDIDVMNNASKQEMENASIGTLQKGSLVYKLDGQVYRTPIKSLRGDYPDTNGKTQNKLRDWGQADFKSSFDDVFQERLYAIQWITHDSLTESRKETYFEGVTESDLKREQKVETLVANNLEAWQKQGFIPDMEIEPGEETTRLRRERGWGYWHHLFSARQLLMGKLIHEQINKLNPEDVPALLPSLAKLMDWSSKLCRYGTGAARESIAQTFYDQAINPQYSYGVRSFVTGANYIFLTKSHSPIAGNYELASKPADAYESDCHILITDPPYADAVSYHEITEFFIAWLRKNPPAPFDKWVWDSRRALAVKGSGDDFRKGMVGAYSAMSKHMPDNGMQCVMFTYQDKAGSTVWPDMVGIFWAAGLQVVAAWYIATETTSELKKGGYVQGTVTLMLRKRPEGEKSGFRNRILPMVRGEVKRQVEQMLNLDEDVFEKMGESVFNDSDLQMAGYAAALKVLTGFTHIDGEDVTNFALRPRKKGEVTVVDVIVQEAAEAASNLLVPDGLESETWLRLSGIQRFYLKMMDIETTGAAKLDNYQNFAKAFRVADYSKVMGSMTPTQAHLTTISSFESRNISDSSEIGATYLGNLIIAIQQLLEEVEPQAVIQQLQLDLPDFMEVRPLLVDVCGFIATKSREVDVRGSAEVLASRLKNLRALGQ